MLRCLIRKNSTRNSSSLPISFGELSKLLASSENVEIFEKPVEFSSKVSKRHSTEVPQVSTTPKKLRNPRSFQQVLRESPSFRDIVNSEKEVEKVLMKSAELLIDKHGSISNIQAEEEDHLLEKVETAFPIEKIDSLEITRSKLNKMTFNVAKFINHSSTLKKLVDMGVNISHWEKMKMVDVAMSLKFKADVAPKIKFLKEQGISSAEMGELFTHCPKLFTIDDDDLKMRLEYLKSKNFTKEMICSIIRLSHCKWFTHDVKDIDNRLGYFQSSFSLTGNQVRKLASECPDLIIWVGTPFQVNQNKLFLTSMMGFNSEEISVILLNEPQVFLAKHERNLQSTFDILHNVIGLSHELLSKFPSVLIGNHVTIGDRHEFLTKLGRNQYDPKKPNYISPSFLVESTDEDFCLKAAKVPVRVFNQYLKTR